MSVLVIGRDGQLSESLLRAAPGLTAYGLDRVDLTRPEEAEAAVIAARPSLVINAAAHTAVDKAESEEDLAYVAEQFKVSGFRGRVPLNFPLLVGPVI